MSLRNILPFLFMLSWAAGASADDATLSPDWTLADTDGKPVHLAAEVAERPTLLFFWATWCPYCKALMPHLQSLKFEYGDRLNIIAITIRDDDGDPLTYLKNGGFEFTAILDGDEIAAKNDVYGTPGVLLLDAERQVVFNLYKLPKVEPPETAEPAGHRRKSAYKAPFWAAEIRRSIDTLMAESYPQLASPQ